ncbi:MAG TPA: MFS transporter [Candidatus Limnocylindrales bacterium]|nr:MFS transporter [Candidatus Limnocylindrales bacterium]
MADQPRPLPLRSAFDGLKRGFAALSIRNYRLYWWGQVVSLIGTWMQQVSLPWLILALGGSPIQLGFVAVLQFGPALFLAPFGGVFADRIDRRLALMATQAAASVQAFVVFLLVATGVVEIWMVMVMALVLGIVNAVDMPLRQTLASDLVPRHLLHNAIALNSMAFNGARVVGPALAGVIIATGTGLTGSTLAGVAINLGINTVTYAGVLTGLLRMNPREIRRVERPEVHPPVLESLREGFWYAVRTPLVLWCLVLLGGIAAFGFNFQILLPLFATGILHLNADGYGALFAAMGVGSLAGSLTLAIMRRRRAIPLMIGGGVVFSFLLVAIAASRNVWLAAPLILAAGFFSMLMINTINATVQANVTDALRGRVMSFYVTVFAGSAPLGGLFAGFVAEGWGTPAAFVAGAVLSLATVGVVALGLRTAGRRGSLGVTMLDTSSERPGELGRAAEARTSAAR